MMRELSLRHIGRNILKCLLKLHGINLIQIMLKGVVSTIRYLINLIPLPDETMTVLLNQIKNYHWNQAKYRGQKSYDVINSTML